MFLCTWAVSISWLMLDSIFFRCPFSRIVFSGKVWYIFSALVDRIQRVVITFFLNVYSTVFEICLRIWIREENIKIAPQFRLSSDSKSNLYIWIEAKSISLWPNNSVLSVFRVWYCFVCLCVCVRVNHDCVFKLFTCDLNVLCVHIWLINWFNWFNKLFSNTAAASKKKISKLCKYSYEFMNNGKYPSVGSYKHFKKKIKNRTKWRIHNKSSELTITTLRWI